MAAVVIKSTSVSNFQFLHYIHFVTGIGTEIVYDLAKRGARVIIAARHVDKAQEVAGNFQLSN